MIRLRLLGGTELTGPDGREITAVLQQPKRLAVLALLAGGHPRWQRRDTLVAMFWPEMDDERARAGLRRALTFLRTHLGEAVILTRGDEVAVEADALWCDVVACAEALRDGRLADAVELHRGDLLAGIHVPSAPQFERWADGMRERLRREVADAAARLATAAQNAERLAEAAAWRRRALELRPDDETALRDLVTLLDRLGDRTGAVRAYDEFARRLAADFDLTPSAETQALMTSLRTRIEAGAVPAAPTPAATPSRNVVAVFPFTVRGPADMHFLREGMVDLLSTKLDGAGDLRTIDPGSVLAHAAALGTAPADPASARAVARQLGAGSFLLGSVVADGERTLLRATLHASDGGSEVRVDAEADAGTGVFELVDELVRRLLATRTESLGGQLTRLGAMTTGSLAALRAYLDGERAFRRGRAHESRAAYASATELDVDFALAHYRLATAHAACGNPVAAVEAVERATARARHLSPHTRILLAAQAALLRGALADAERLSLRLLADRPDDVEAWYRLARVQLDGSRFRGRAEAEARPALERVAALDPRHAAALADLARLAWTTGDRQAAREYARRYLSLSADGDDAPVMAVIGQSEDAGERLAAARPASVRQIAALEMLGAAVPAGAAAVGPWASLLTAHLATARAAPADARAALQRAAQFDPELALDHEAFLSTVARGWPTADDALVERLGVGRAEAAPASVTTLAAAVRPATRLHSLGLVLLARDAVDAAADCARTCRALALPPWTATLPALLASGIEARIALRRGEPDRALALLEGGELGPWIHVAAEVPECGLVAERLARAEALAALGRGDEARAWLTPPATLRPLEWAVRAS